MKLKIRTLMLFCAFAFFTWTLVGAVYGTLTYDIDSHNCKYSSIVTHDLLAAYGMQSHYACAILTPNEGHVWNVIDVGLFDIPFESGSIGVPKPRFLIRYSNPDYTFNTTEDMLTFEQNYFIDP